MRRARTGKRPPPRKHSAILYLLPAILFVHAGCNAPAGDAPATATGDPDTTRVEAVDLSRHFEGLDGTFVVWDAANGRLRVYNPERARRRFLPASTFKIPNSLVALETGVATGPDFALGRDTVKAPAEAWWPRAWREDQTLRTAFRNSVYWYYQELARRIGQERMQTYLDRFDYGNRSQEGGVDRFWLEGGLRISPYEQVAFLRRFYDDELGLSPETQAAARDLFVLEEAPAYRLSGKTGTADVTETREMGWLVGYVERDGAVSYYALNMEGERVWEDWPPQTRAGLVKTLLREMDVLPAAETVAAPQKGPINHVVLVWLKEPGNAEHRRFVIEESRRLAAIPGVMELEVGEVIPSDRAVVDATFDVALTMSFATMEALEAYLVHPDHLALVREKLPPILDRIRVYDYREAE